MAASRRSNGHGVLAEFLAQIRDRSAGKLAGDLGDGVSRESEGGGGRSRRHVASSAGNAFLCSSPSAQDLAGKLRGEKMTVDASQCFFASSRLGLARAGQGDKAIGTPLQMLFECSFMQRGHSLVSAALLK
jgi:hypothetical protein